MAIVANFKILLIYPLLSLFSLCKGPCDYSLLTSLLQQDSRWKHCLNHYIFLCYCWLCSFKCIGLWIYGLFAFVPFCFIFSNELVPSVFLLTILCYTWRYVEENVLLTILYIKVKMQLIQFNHPFFRGMFIFLYCITSSIKFSFSIKRKILDWGKSSL